MPLNLRYYPAGLITTFLSDNPQLDQSLLHPIKTALRNSRKMLSLIGQVLDIKQLESGRFPLRIAQYDVADMINHVVKRFIPWAQQHKQNILTTNTDEVELLYFDFEQIEKCLSNLISNAIKYSGNSSQITITLVKNKDRIGIEVSDTGKGISTDFENVIFQRYTQAKSSERITEPGTGIGLALVKELMELQHGEVELLNKSEMGCAFTLWLRTGREHFDDNLLIDPIAVDNELDDETWLPTPTIKLDSSNNNDITTLLVVDDNQELCEFIVSRLASYYRVLQASDGQEGFSMAQSSLPDLIISDVMMPKMNGLEMIEKLKSSKLTKYIPIILLSAKTSKRETVEGIETGADDYLTKPFDMSELIVRVKGLIDTRKVIRNQITKKLSKELTGVASTSSFIEKLRKEMLTQLSDPKLNIDSLSAALAMSRSSFNRKCQKELKQTPTQYITETRMHHALILLKEKQHSVSEIAYGVGYDSLTYFSKVFKKHYGQPPSSVT